MYLKYLEDPNIFKLLYKIDMDLAEIYRQKSCKHCNSSLHYSNYLRKCREGDDEFIKKFSLCCSKCRKRCYVPSTLFFGAVVYSSVFFIVISCLTSSAGHSINSLKRKYKLSDRTLRRWKKWWNSTFMQSSFWKEKKASFSFDMGIFPSSILEQFKNLESLLKFLSGYFMRN